MRRRLGRCAGLLVVYLAATSWAGGHARSAAAAPVAPCGGDRLEQEFAPPGEPPSVRLWEEDTLPADWRPAPCSGIERRDGAVLVAVAGRFESPLDGRQLLARLGTVSEHTTINYWSPKKERWQPLLEDAYALTGPDAERARHDFTAAELESGEKLHLVYDDAEPVGPVVTLVEIVSVDAASFAVTSRNLTAARVIGLPIAGPGDISSYLSVEREAEDVYRYFALSSSALSMPLLSEATQINRAVAVYRYIAGIDGDQRPPVASE
jgi:hypothetical protein